VAKILDRFSINYPPTLKRLLTIKMNNENKIKIEREEFKAKLKAIKIVKEENATEIFNANREKILEQVYKLNNLSGKKRRSLRSKFNQTYGANSFEIREIATTILDAAI
jgi:glycerophosphoryl diester phosphodiesterase